MARRPRSHQIEDLSRDRVRSAFNSLGWTVEDLRKDYGEDLLVRIFETGVATPLMFFTQCKGTDSVENYISRGKRKLLFPVKMRHIEHWDRFWEPVILSVWDSKTDRTYWRMGTDGTFSDIYPTVRVAVLRRLRVNRNT